MKNQYEERDGITVITVKLPGGELTETVIDVADLPVADEMPNTWWVNGNGYVQSAFTRHGKRQFVQLHRLLVDAPMVDHINRNRLDNRRANLRTASYSLNSFNRRMQLNNTSGYRGVWWHKEAKCWTARIQENGTKRYLGWFATAEEASTAFEAAYQQRMVALTG